MVGSALTGNLEISVGERANANASMIYFNAKKRKKILYDINHMHMIPIILHTVYRQSDTFRSFLTNQSINQKLLLVT